MQHALPLTWTDNGAQSPETADLARFLMAFTLDDLPACPTGMALLLKFAEAKPTGYAKARRAGFTASERCSYATNPEWRAFVRHRGRCYDCCESGPAIEYDYFPYKPPTAEELRAYEAAARKPKARAALKSYRNALEAIEEEWRAGRRMAPQRRNAQAARRALDMQLGRRPVGRHIN